jgi:hypothetical protein
MGGPPPFGCGFVNFALPEARGTRLGGADMGFTLLLRAVAAGRGSGGDPTVSAPIRLRVARDRHIRALGNLGSEKNVACFGDDPEKLRSVRIVASSRVVPLVRACEVIRALPWIGSVATTDGRVTDGVVDRPISPVRRSRRGSADGGD